MRKLEWSFEFAKLTFKRTVHSYNYTKLSNKTHKRKQLEKKNCLTMCNKNGLIAIIQYSNITAIST